MWLCMKWRDVMHGCMVYTVRTEDGSSFEWHQPCNNQTALQLHHLGHHSFRVTWDKNAVSLLKRGEQCYIKAINNSKPASLNTKLSCPVTHTWWQFTAKPSCFRKWWWWQEPKTIKRKQALCRSKQIKGSKECLFIMTQTHNLQNFWGNPLCVKWINHLSSWIFFSHIFQIPKGWYQNEECVCVCVCMCVRLHASLLCMYVYTHDLRNLTHYCE